MQLSAYVYVRNNKSLTICGVVGAKIQVLPNSGTTVVSCPGRKAMSKSANERPSGHPGEYSLDLFTTSTKDSKTEDEYEH